MGLVLDSSVLIDAERARRPVSQLLSSIQSGYLEVQFVISSISVVEIEHGWHRAQSPEIALNRRRFLDEVYAITPIEPFTHEMGMLAAKLAAETRKMGQSIAMADLLIGATALQFNYAVGTRNLRHFQMIPGLTVLAL